MSTILDALRKAKDEEDSTGDPYRMIDVESPYDKRTVALEQRLMKKARGYRWIAVSFGALLALALTAVICLALIGRGGRSASSNETRLAAVGSTPIPQTSDESDSGIVPAPVHMPPNYVRITENQPHPYAVEPHDTPLRTPPESTQVPATAPIETSVPMSPKLLLEPPPIAAFPNPTSIATQPASTPGLSATQSSEPTFAKANPPKPSPTKPPKPKPVIDASHFEFGGILWDEDDPMAMINDRVVRQGDYLGKAKVAAIDKRSVTLVYDGKEIVLE